MPRRHRPDPSRRRYTVVVEQVTADSFHLEVEELPRTWTVAFERDTIEERARQRIALDLGCDPGDFEIALKFRPFFLERRAHRRATDRAASD